MNIQEVAKKLAVQNNLKAEKFNLYLRDFDNVVELIGLVPDPNYDMKDFVGREMLFPKRWVTLKTFDTEMRV
jgi:hypothetical protein